MVGKAKKKRNLSKRRKRRLEKKLKKLRKKGAI